MWRWRRMDKTIWTSRVKNEEVLHRDKEERNILLTVKRRKGKWIVTFCIGTFFFYGSTLFLLWRNSPTRARAVPFLNSLITHSDTPKLIGLLSTSDRPDAEQSLQTDIHATDGIRNRTTSKRSESDPHLRPLGPQNQQTEALYRTNSVVTTKTGEYGVKALHRYIPTTHSKTNLPSSRGNWLPWRHQCVTFKRRLLQNG
jgi:hypothetical protein